MSELKPLELKKLDVRTLGIRWSDGHESLYDSTFLRGECSCAACRDEWTGERKLLPGMLPQTVLPVQIDSVGHYALAIRFSDGHASGLYPYVILRGLCQCTSCKVD